MYHDILSHPRLAWMLDKYAGKGTPIREAWTTMAWVAAGRQEGSFYLLFKWYEDFFDPPQRTDLYFLQWEEEQVRVRFLNRDFLAKLDPREQGYYASFPSRVSQNASYFFGETKFDSNPVRRILHLLETYPQQDLECFDWHLGRRSDGEKGLLCATVSAYFRSLQAVREVLYGLVDSDGWAAQGRRPLHTGDLLDLLGALTPWVAEEDLPRLAGRFQSLAGRFVQDPNPSPFLGRGAGRALMDRTETEELTWVRLGTASGRRLLRELYFRCAPRQVWDVFYRWQGEVYFTVLRRPLTRELSRGVYLLSRFEDPTGLDVTSLFWLETLSVGVAHLCQGEFLEELFELVPPHCFREGSLPPFHPRPEGLVSLYSNQLKEIFDQYDRGFG